MALLSIAMFICLFAFGERTFGWHDPQGRVQLALVASFLFGIISSYRNRG